MTPPQELLCSDELDISDASISITERLKSKAVVFGKSNGDHPEDNEGATGGSCLRCLVPLLLIASVVAISTVVCVSMKRVEEDAMEQQFDHWASLLVNSFHENAKLRLQVLDMMALSLTGSALATTQIWPFVTIHHNWEAHATAARSILGASHLALHPYVPNELKQPFQQYTQQLENSVWLNESRAFQKQYQNIRKLATEFNIIGFENNTTNDASKEGTEFDIQFDGDEVIVNSNPPSSSSSTASNNNNAAANGQTDSTSTNANHEDSSAKEENDVNHLDDPNDFETMETNYNGPSYPLWQVSPAPLQEVSTLDDDDLLDRPGFYQDVVPLVQSRGEAVFGGTMGNTSSNPTIALLYPVFNQILPPKKVAAVLEVDMALSSLLESVLPPHASAMTCVVSNCEQAFTFQVIGRDVVYLGASNSTSSTKDGVTTLLTDFQSYHGVPVNTEYCPWKLQVYATPELHDEFVTSRPVHALLAILGSFLLGCLLTLAAAWWRGSEVATPTVSQQEKPSKTKANPNALSKMVQKSIRNLPSRGWFGPKEQVESATTRCTKDDGGVRMDIENSEGDYVWAIEQALVGMPGTNKEKYQFASKHYKTIGWVVDLLCQQLQEIDMERRDNAPREAHNNVWRHFDTADLDVNWSKALSKAMFLGDRYRARDDESSRRKIDGKLQEQMRLFISCLAYQHKGGLAFHSFEHACEVLSSAEKMLRKLNSKLGIEHKLNAWVKFTVFLSAIIADSHPFHTAGLKEVLEKYDELDTSHSRLDRNNNVYHASLEVAWCILMDNDLKDLRMCLCANKTEYDSFRQLLVNLTLGSDISSRYLYQQREQRWLEASSASKSLNVHRRAASILEQIMIASHWIHTMKDWDTYLKWSNRLHKELCHLYKRGKLPADPSVDWYEREILLFKKVIIPLSERLQAPEVLGASGCQFNKNATQNCAQWTNSQKESEERSSHLLEVEDSSQPDGLDHSEPSFHEV